MALAAAMEGEAYWQPASIYPSILDNGMQMNDRAAAGRVGINYHVVFGYPEGAVIDPLQPGEEFPELTADGPVLGAVIDSKFVGPEAWIDRMTERVGPHLYETAEEFDNGAELVDIPGYYGAPVGLRLAHPLGATLLSRSHYYVEASSHVYDQFVGLCSDQVQAHASPSDQERFDDRGAYYAADAPSIEREGNSILPRLQVDRSYRRQYAVAGGLEHLRVISAYVLWLPENVLVRYPAPHPRQSPEVVHIPRQRPPSNGP